MQALRVFAAVAFILAVISIGSADIPKPSDVPPLVKQLTTPSMPAKTRAEAARELGRIGQIKVSYVKDAIPHLLKAAKDKDDNVRREALLALGMSNPEPDTAVPVMIEGLKSSNDQVKIAAAEALGYLGGAAKDALPELRRLREELDKMGKEENKKKKRDVMQVRQAVNQATMSIMERQKKK